MQTVETYEQACPAVKGGENMNGLSAVRDAYGLTLEEVANMLGVKRQSVYEWCRPNGKIPSKRIKQLSALLAIPEQYLTLAEASEDDVIVMQKYALENSMDKTSKEYNRIVNEKDSKKIVMFLEENREDAIEPKHVSEAKLLESKAMDRIHEVMNHIQHATTTEAALLEYGENIALFQRFSDVVDSKRLSYDFLHRVMRALELVALSNGSSDLSLGSERALTKDLVTLFIKHLTMEDELEKKKKKEMEELLKIFPNWSPQDEE